MDKCWCGNNNFEVYSECYNLCNKCHTLVVKPNISYNPERINDDEDYYGKKYWESKMVNAAKVQNMDQIIDLYMHERAVYWLTNLFLYVLPGHGYIAEVGCGLGQFSYFLKESGYEQIAFELSPEICGYIRHALNLNVVCGAFKPSEKKYNAICAFDVMEHLVDPHVFLETVASSLDPEGIIMIQMPCYDKNLNYAEMLQKKPAFQQQLRESEHVFLFSKESVSDILHEHGFNYIRFIDAFFGNDYDMFFVASRKPLNENTKEKIDSALNRLQHGRLIKAVINSWKEAKKNEKSKKAVERQRDSLICQIDKLTEMVTCLQKQLDVSEKDREERERQINELTGMVKNLQKQLNESEDDREARKRQIIELTEIVTNLQKQLSICEEDRENRLQQILVLTDMINGNK